MDAASQPEQVRLSFIMMLCRKLCSICGCLLLGALEAVGGYVYLVCQCKIGDDNLPVAQGVPAADPSPNTAVHCSLLLAVAAHTSLSLC